MICENYLAYLFWRVFSHMSMIGDPNPHAPKRARGHQRVAAIMEAGAALFKEHGYDAVTMTEIAARSGTAFGSLYRFFPSKEALADALLLRYAQNALDRLAAVGDRSATMTLDELTDAFIDFMLELQTERSFAIAVIDARGDHDDKRSQFREALRSGIAAIARKACPGSTKAKSAAMAIAILHILKGLAGTARETESVRRSLKAEYRLMLRFYLASATRGATPN